MSKGNDLAYSINQAASEPHDTNAGNEIFDEYLLSRTHPHSLPEDSEGYQALQAFLHSRRLPDNACQPVHGFADGWEGEYVLKSGRFHIHPELRPYGDKNVYRDFYDTEDEYVKRLSIKRCETGFEIILNGCTRLIARLDGKLVPVSTHSAMPAYTELACTAVLEKDIMIVDAWFIETCFKNRLWIERDGALLRIRVRKERLHDNEPYFWYEAVMSRVRD